MGRHEELLQDPDYQAMLNERGNWGVERLGCDAAHRALDAGRPYSLDLVPPK